MSKTRWRCSALLLLLGWGVKAGAQQALTWEQVRNRFENNNPTLQAGQFSISESKAQEITAYLRPNPNFTATADQIDPFPGGPPHGPFAYFLPVASVNYLHERQRSGSCGSKAHKRQLRLQPPIRLIWNER